MKVKGQYIGKCAWLAAAILGLGLALGLVFTGCKDKPAQPPDNPPANQKDPPNPHVSTAPPELPAAGDPPNPVVQPDPPGKNSEPEPTAPPKVRMEDVIRSATGWGPVFQSWNGKPAPDFTLTDITGRQHKLSDYRGKDVMLVLWATWCRPCIMEIPHLIALQNVVGKDKLAVLAISYTSPMNTEDMIKSYVAKNERINYTVFAVGEQAMPAPYNMIEGIPSSFFIDRQGNIKLATSGLLSLGYMKAILEAQ
jgi:peroxiredoxin